MEKINVRRVNVYEWKRDQTTKKLEKSQVGIGKLLSFGVDYEECGESAGVFSTAIVEMPDGSIKNVPVEMIKFITFKEDISYG